MTDAPTLLTWAALLAKWTDFARSAVALPKDGEGGLFREAVPAIISLQAVTFALGDLDPLAPDERALGLDRAEVLIRRHAAELHEIWRAQPLHPEVATIIQDARTAAAAARDGGLEWAVDVDRLTIDHPDGLVEALRTLGFDGDLFVPVPGVELFETCPAVFAHGRAGSPPAPEVQHAIEDFYSDLARPERIPGPRQVYRQFDFAAGRLVRDLVVAMDDTLPGGQPLLVQAVRAGTPIPVPIPPRHAPNLPRLPVVFWTGD